MESNVSDDTSRPAVIPANKGVKQGLPASGLPSAEDAATKLWNVARLGTVPPEAFARQFGDKAKASGGAWSTRIAILRGFKLIRHEEKNIGLSELGRQIVDKSNPRAQREARRTAVLNLKAYRDLMESFSGAALPELEALATRLQFEYGKTEDFATRAAKAFVESLKHAEMLVADKIVTRDGVTGSSAPTPNPLASPAYEIEDETADELSDAEIDAAFDEEELGDEVGEESAEEGDAHLATSITLSVKLDLSQFRAEEVIQILKALGLGGRV